jgi:hypothetical protein
MTLKAWWLTEIWSVIMHEMGHVLGIGTLWDKFRKEDADDVDSDPRFVVENAVAGYQLLGGLRGDIPVANTGGTGTRNVHWRESTFEDELMTGFATGDMPVSIMTVNSLQDSGYTVDESKTEAYSILLAQQSSSKGSLNKARTFGDDILRFENDEVMTIPVEDLKPKV